MEQKNGVASSHFGYKTCLGDAEFLFILCFIAYCCIQISFYLKKNSLHILSLLIKMGLIKYLLHITHYVLHNVVYKGRKVLIVCDGLDPFVCLDGNSQWFLLCSKFIPDFMDIKYEIKSFIILLFIWHFVQIYDTVHLKNIICSTANTAAVLSIDSINISHPLVMFTKSVMRRIRIINLLKQSHMSLLIIETQFTIYSTLIIAQPRRCVPLFTYISSRWMVFTKRSDVCRQFRLLRYYIDVHISH